MIRTQPRTVECELVRGGLAHFNSRVKRTVVDVRAKIPELRSQVVTIVVHRHHGSRSTVAVLDVQVRSAFREPPYNIFVSIARGPHQSRETSGRIIRIPTVGER